MKILCVCEGGNSRSVTLALLLKDGLHQDALSMGIRRNSEETKNMLYEWADKIILVAGKCESEIPDKFRDKLVIWDVGDDVYFGGSSRRLITKYKEYMKQDNLGIIDPNFLDWMDSAANRD